MVYEETSSPIEQAKPLQLSRIEVGDTHDIFVSSHSAYDIDSEKTLEGIDSGDKVRETFQRVFGLHALNNTNADRMGRKPLSF
jgi:hypothetical protein